MPIRADDPAVAAVQAMYDRLQAEGVDPDDALNALLSAVAGVLVASSADLAALNYRELRAVEMLRAKTSGSVAMGLLGAGLRGGSDANPA